MKHLNVSDVKMASNLSRLLLSYTEIPARTFLLPPVPTSRVAVSDFRWNHFENEGLVKIEDLLLRQESDGDCVSAVFQYISH